MMDAENRSYLNARFGPNWQQTGFDADRARLGKELLNMESNVVSSAVNSESQTCREAGHIHSYWQEKGRERPR